MSRDEHGILEVTLHTNGDSLRWGIGPSHEFPLAFRDICGDRGNRVVIIAGAGDEFIGPRADEVNMSSFVEASGGGHDAIFYEREGGLAREMLQSLLEIPVPVVCAVNGPVLRHCELALMADVIVCSETASFEDSAHFKLQDLVPGDGIFEIAVMLMGINRARAFVLTGDPIPADEALRLGLVAKVLPRQEVLPRARQIAMEMAAKPDVVLRYTRSMMVQPIRERMLADLGRSMAYEALGALAPDVEQPAR
jgi:enoyl-CoA hydratase/carnithine racemase